MNLEAVDRVVRIVRELDRYHGLFAPGRRLPEASRRITIRELEAPVEGTMAFGAALACRAELAPQGPEKIEFALDAPLDRRVALRAPRDAIAPLRLRAIRGRCLPGLAGRNRIESLRLRRPKGFTASDATAIPSAPAALDRHPPGLTRGSLATTVESLPRSASCLGARIAGNWRRKALKRFNPRPDLRWAPKPPAARMRRESRPPAPQDLHTPDARPNDRPENSSQGLENAESAPGNDGPAHASASGRAPSSARLS